MIDYGTLGVSRSDPYVFFGISENAQIDGGLCLRGLPPADAFKEGLVISVPLVGEGYFCVYPKSCWEARVEKLGRMPLEFVSRMRPHQPSLRSSASTAFKMAAAMASTSACWDAGFGGPATDARLSFRRFTLCSV